MIWSRLDKNRKNGKERSKLSLGRESEAMTAPACKEMTIYQF